MSDRQDWSDRKDQGSGRSRGEAINVVTVFRELGYNLYNDDDVIRLGDNLRFAEEERKRQELMRANKLTWISNSFVALLGAGAAGLVTFFVNRWSR